MQSFRPLKLAFAFIFLFTLPSFAQVNLVPNPSFEADKDAPVITTFNWNHYNDWQKDSLWENSSGDEVEKSSILTVGWFQPTGGTPDYLNSDQSNLLGFKTKTARTGNGRMAIITGICKNGLVSWLLYKDTYSEYIECKLNKSLQAGKMYCVRYYVALDEKSNFATNHFGAMITRNRVDLKSHTSIFQFEDDVHINAAEDHYITSDEGWVMICDTFVAKGGEKYLTIGSFEGDFPKRTHAVNKKEHTSLRVTPFSKFAYYYLDDVSLMEVKPDEALCEAPRDSVTRDNIVFMIDVSGSMEPKGYIAAAKNSILPLINALPPGDHISIIAYSDNPVILCDNVTAADTGIIRKSLETIKPGGGTNVVGAFKVAYELIRKKMVSGGTNKIVVMTDGKIYMPKSERKKIVSAKENEGITLSVVFFGDEVPKDVEQLAAIAGGDASAAKNGNADEALRQQVPTHVVDTKYGTRNPGKIFNWEFLTKVVLPGLLALVILRATRTI